MAVELWRTGRLSREQFLDGQHITRILQSLVEEMRPDSRWKLREFEHWKNADRMDVELWLKYARAQERQRSAFRPARGRARFRL